TMAIAVIVSHRAGRFLMRVSWLVAAAVFLGLACPALAQDTPSISEELTLVAHSHCVTHKDPANQLVCGDPDLNGAGEKLNAAIQERMNRLADRRAAIEDNAQWA